MGQAACTARLQSAMTCAGRGSEVALRILEVRSGEGQTAREIRKGNPVAMARGLLLATHGFVLSVHTMVDEEATEQELDAELATLITRTLAP